MRMYGILYIDTFLNWWNNSIEAVSWQRKMSVLQNWIYGNVHVLFGCHIGIISLWAVREITKSSSTYSVTNISSNIAWLLELHDIIQIKSNYTWINYDHDNIAIWSHIIIYNFVWNSIFGTKFSSIYLGKGENLLTCSARKMVLICLMQNIDMCLLYKSHQFARLVSQINNHFSKWMFTV